MTDLVYGTGSYPPIPPGHPELQNGNVSLANRALRNFGGGLNDRNSTAQGRRDFPHYADDPHTYGSEFSMADDFGNNRYSIPTIWDGVLHGKEEAIQHFQETGEFLLKGPKGGSDAFDKQEFKIHARPIMVNGKIFHGFEQ